MATWWFQKGNCPMLYHKESWMVRFTATRTLTKRAVAVIVTNIYSPPLPINTLMTSISSYENGWWLNYRCHGNDMQGSASGGEWHGRHGLLRRFEQVGCSDFCSFFSLSHHSKRKSNHGSSRIASRRHGQHVQLYVNHPNALRAFWRCFNISTFTVTTSFRRGNPTTL